MGSPRSDLANTLSVIMAASARAKFLEFDHHAGTCRPCQTTLFQAGWRSSGLVLCTTGEILYADWTRSETLAALL